MNWTYLVVIIILSDGMATADNVLFLSLPYYGHINPMVKVAGELTNYGHTSYITIPEKFSRKFSPVRKGVNFFITEEFQEFAIFNDVLLELLRLTEYNALKESLNSLHKVCDRYLLDEDIFLRLKSLNASLVVVDANFVSNCLAVFAYRLKIPFVLLGHHNQINIHLTPWAISIFPHFSIRQARMTSFMTKIRNAFYHFQDYINPAIGSPGKDIKAYAPERPNISFDKLIRRAQLYIIDSDYFLHLALPALPNVKYIGGIATQPARPLEGRILKFVNASKYGVIVVSPGSLVSWEFHVKKMEEAFSKIKYDVVWKHSNSSYFRSNVLLTKWLPQNDLLGHQKTKLFITHCGNSGQYESLYHAIPMIAFPVISDQFYNGRNIHSKNYGITMDINNFTVDELVRNIEEVIENPKYKKNIAKMSEIFRSQDLPSVRAARLVEEMVKYGGDHLRSEIQDIPLYEFLMLDILVVLFAIGFVIFSLTAFILRNCFTTACRKMKTKTE